MTNAQLVLEKIKETLCHEGTTYKGRSGTYKYVVGKTTAEGTINGVVKKIDEAGQGKTAGSFKILADLIYSQKFLKINDVIIKFNYRTKGKSKLNFNILILLIKFMTLKFFKIL